MTLVPEVEGGASLPSFLSFDQALNQFSIYTTDEGLVGSYNIDVKFYFGSYSSTLESLGIFKVTIEGSGVYVKEVPYFMSSLQTISLKERERLIYTLPEVACKDYSFCSVNATLGVLRRFIFLQN